MTTSVDSNDSVSTMPVYLLVFTGALVALGPLTIDAYLPALPTIARAFGVDVPTISTSVSTYLLGYAIGQFFGGPLSDQIGRRPIAIGGLGLFVFATLGILFADTVDWFLFLRFVQAIGGGFSTVVAMALVRDLSAPVEVGRRFATITLIVMLAPLIAPTVGSFLLQFSWQSIFWLFVVYSVALLFVLIRVVPETLASPRSLSIRSVFRQYAAVVTARMNGGQLAVQFPIAMAFAGGVMMIFITQSAFLYMEQLAVSENVFPLFFGANVVLLIACNLLSMRMLGRVNPQTLFRAGLLVQLIAVSALFLLVVFDNAQLTLVVPAIMFSIGSIGLINPAGMALYMSNFPTTGGSATAVFTTMMFMLGGVLGALPSLLQASGILPIVVVMLIATLTANVVGRSARNVALPNHELHKQATES